MDIRDAIAEANAFIAAASGLGDHREVRLMAASAGEDAVISLGAVRALASLATVREASSLDELVALVRWHQGAGQKELRCSPDVCRALPRAVGGGYRSVPPDIPVSMALGIKVVMMDHYGPGQWKLVLHDRCDVTGGETIDQAIIVTHDRCTVLGQSA